MSKYIITMIKMPQQHDPCADALTLTRLLAEDQQKHVAFVREQQNKEIMARYGIIRG